jgi:hypothetical protein
MRRALHRLAEKGTGRRDLGSPLLTVQRSVINFPPSAHYDVVSHHKPCKFGCTR